jgi:hypothetical protein
MRTGLVTVFLVIFATPAYSQLMTVQNLKELLAKGHEGEVAATAYVQGTVDGMLALDSLHQKEKALPSEFCKFKASFQKGRPETHPAYRTKELVAAWERQGLPMQTLAVDFVLAFMTAQYGCSS